MRIQNIALLIVSVSLAVIAVAVLTQTLKTDTPAQITIIPPENPSVPPDQAESSELPPQVRPDDPPPNADLRVIHFPDSDGGRNQTFAVVRKAENWLAPGDYRWTVSFYRLLYKHDKDADLVYLGGRCIEYDMGADMIGMDAKNGWRPEDFRKLKEDALRKAKDD